MYNPLEIEEELILFSDESVNKGTYFSNFYGGVLVGTSKYENISRSLHEVLIRTGLSGEIKWSKVTQLRLDGYKAIITTFFSEIYKGNLKIRIMFTQNSQVPMNITTDHHKNKYFLLYYQFIKHAFGLQDMSFQKDTINLRLYFDQFPDNRKKANEFKKHIVRLQDSTVFNASPLVIKKENIAEVKSHEHILLQCLDVVLGAMAFRLNDMHKISDLRNKPKRTVAKDKLYKFIRQLICVIKPNFNVGVTTSATDWYRDRTDLPYAHWKFKPKEFEFDKTKTKRQKK